jgi:branched-chain amino acid transport system ATP-binding protein
LSALLSLDNVSVAYDKAEAVRKASLVVQPGGIVTVIGPNGAGKTTLLMATIGLLPFSGRIAFDGVDLSGLEVEERVERGLCLVPEKRELCQMLALGRALMMRPRLLMLDEPSLGLAPLIVREIFKAIASLREIGVSILLVEQNARAALQTADYGYILETGEITGAGPAAELLADPALIATYLGSR